MEHYSNFIGIDLGDRNSHVCVTDGAGAVLRELSVKTELVALVGALSAWPGSRVALETGTHSLWVARGLLAAGHSVVVAD